MIVSPAKTAEPIEMPFGWWTQVGQGKHCVGWGPDTPWEWAVFRQKGAAHCKV